MRKFEDNKAWQKSRELTREIYEHFRDHKDYGFRDQIQRASVSIMNNLAEGQERGSNKEFIHFMYIAKGSCGEVRSMLYLAHDLGYLQSDECNALHKKTIEISGLTGGLIKYLKERDN